MKTILYLDGFNLFDSAVKGTPLPINRETRQRREIELPQKSAQNTNDNQIPTLGYRSSNIGDSAKPLD